MTRLKTDDIESIAARLRDYNTFLQRSTGRGLLGIACHCCQADETVVTERASHYTVQVVPTTAGLGIIGDFSETVCTILRFLGFAAEVSVNSDIAGLSEAFAKGAEAIFAADDHRFVAIDLHTRTVVDNSQATGCVYGAALDLMAGGVRDQDVLVLGCGPVGEAASRKLLALGARVALHDCSPTAALSLRANLKTEIPLVIEKHLDTVVGRYRYILDATPAAELIPDELIVDNLFISAPGVPLGLSDAGRQRLTTRLIHDKLELGVATMAVSLLSSTPYGDYFE
ncbi:MAG: 3-methylornithyl-N6-L-lysine dehydrogenase PylD [Desulfopila sp.]